MSARPTPASTWSAAAAGEGTASPATTSDPATSRPRTSPRRRMRRTLLGGHEVDQMLDRTQQRDLEIGVRADSGEHPAPALPRLAPAERRTHPFLPGPAGRDDRPRLDADSGRLHRLPDVDVRMAVDEHVRVPHTGDDPRLLAARDQVVDEDTEPAAGPG